MVLFSSGAVTVTGGTGIDLYSFVNGKAGGSVVISGFKVGTDQVALYNYAPFTVATTITGGNITINLGDGTRLTLLGVTGLTANSII